MRRARAAKCALLDDWDGDQIDLLKSGCYAVLIVAFCVSAAMFIVMPIVKWLLIAVFEALGHEEGALRLLRQWMSFPITSMLSRQRKARRGDGDAAAQLFLIDVGVGALISVEIQGLLTTFLAVVVLWALFIAGYLLLQ